MFNKIINMKLSIKTAILIIGALAVIGVTVSVIWPSKEMPQETQPVSTEVDKRKKEVDWDALEKELEERMQFKTIFDKN